MAHYTLAGPTIWTLRAAFKKNRSRIWKDLERRLSAPRSNKSEVNIGKLANVTKDGETVAIAGKLLGSGSIGHRLTVYALSISEQAANKITQAGGKLISADDLIQKHPKGRGVRIIG
jgi:large subunit ribosomal protein L18e